MTVVTCTQAHMAMLCAISILRHSNWMLAMLKDTTTMILKYLSYGFEFYILHGLSARYGVTNIYICVLLSMLQILCLPTSNYKSVINSLNISHMFRSQWPRGLRHELSPLARTLGSWVRIPLKTWLSVLCAFILFVLFCVEVETLWLADPRPRSPTYCV
jgi:hypothetical protein